MPHTYYEILGVSSEASNIDIKAAYREAVLRLHPDKVLAAETPSDNRHYQELQTAWTVQLQTFLWQWLAGFTQHLCITCIV